MLDDSQNEAIVRFVRDRLGCQCPEEVFNSIEIAYGSAPNGETGFSKLVVGKRLLIYVATPMSEALINGVVSAFAVMGRLERDRQGYNRFRLVLAAQDEAGSQGAIGLFKNIVGADEKAHIHVVAPNEVPDVLTR